MVAFIDKFPYPFENLIAQELLRVLAGLYRTEREALLVTQPLGIDPHSVPPNLSPVELWYHLLQALARHGAVPALLKTALEQFPSNPRRVFLESLLADRSTEISAEPLYASTQDFDDTVSEREALLFFDDLTMPVGAVPILIDTLQRMIDLAPSVCLLRIQNLHGSFFGTGFRVSRHLILSNYHVLFPHDSVATQVRADFGFDVDAGGASLAVKSLSGSVESIKGEKADDWAIVAIPDMQSEKWPIIALDAQIEPKIGDPAYILQHPGGQQKRLGYVRNLITDIGESFVRYITDTQPGSSGSPVFDAEGRLIAMHHAGGRPVEVAGKPPLSKNEGIKITKIIARFKYLGINL